MSSNTSGLITAQHLAIDEVLNGMKLSPFCILQSSSNLPPLTSIIVCFIEAHTKENIFKWNISHPNIFYFHLHSIFTIRESTNSIEICSREMYDVEIFSVWSLAYHFNIRIIGSYIKRYFKYICSSDERRSIIINISKGPL